METTRTTASVRISDHAFGTVGEFTMPFETAIQTADWSNGMVITMPIGAMIYTGIDSGQVRVTTELLPKAPDTIDSDPWDDIVEVTLDGTHGELRVHCMQYGPFDTPPPLPRLNHQGAGPYRLRAHVRGRDLHYDEIHDDPNEAYLLTLWPARPAPSLIIRATDSCGYGVRLASQAGTRLPDEPMTPMAIDAEHRNRQDLIDARLNQAARGETDAPRTES